MQHSGVAAGIKTTLINKSPLEKKNKSAKQRAEKDLFYKRTERKDHVLSANIKKICVATFKSSCLCPD